MHLKIFNAFTQSSYVGRSKTKDQAYSEAKALVREEANTKTTDGLPGGQYRENMFDPTTLTSNKTKYQNLVKAFPHMNLFILSLTCLQLMLTNLERTLNT